MSDILPESQADDEIKNTGVNCVEAIALAVQELRVLRNQMSNFVAFEGEATGLLTSLFEKWKKERALTNRVLMSTIEVGSLIAKEISQWLKIIHRRLSPRMKALHPWTIKFTRYMSWKVFGALKDAISKSSTRYGILLLQTNREDIISYTTINRVHRDFEQFCRLPCTEVVHYFSRICGGKRRGKVAVLVTPEKPDTEKDKVMLL